MKIGLSIADFTWPAGPAKLGDTIKAVATTADQAGFDSIWVMDHYWSQRPDGRYGSYEPMVTLAYLAARTNRVRLGPLVACNSFRHPGQLGREALALADASQGRFVLGIGAGWYQPEYDAFGIPFDHRVSRLEETLGVLPQLLRGEVVSYRGRYVTLQDASLTSTTDAPPIWIAGAGQRMLELTARHADGWNVAWYGEDPSEFADSLRGLRAAMAAVGRAAYEIEITVGVLVLPHPGADSVDGRAIAGGPERVAQRLRAYGEAGADLVIVSLAPVPFGELDPSYPERMAEVLKHLD